MRRNQFSRRMLLAGSGAAFAARRAQALQREPRVQIGKPWPIFGRAEEEALLGVLRSGKWGRIEGSRVAEFERQYRELLGVEHCVATANGTSALIAAKTRVSSRAPTERVSDIEICVGSMILTARCAV